MPHMRGIRVATLLLAPGLLFVGLAAGVQQPAVKVYKSPTCRCCSKWVAHLRQRGFSVTTTEMSDLSEIKARHKIPGGLASCHTAVVEGYVVEGHVPAVDVERLLKERPPVAGLAVPGMPIGSPGMEGPNPVAYDVLSFDRRGTSKVFSSHRP